MVAIAELNGVKLKNCISLTICLCLSVSVNLFVLKSNDYPEQFDDFLRRNYDFRGHFYKVTKLASLGTKN